MADVTTNTIKNLKIGQFVLLDGEVCKVVGLDISKSGKHGASKARLDAMGIFDGKRRSVVKPADSSIDVPIILKKTAQVLAISGNIAQLMDLEDYSQFDAEIPKDIKGTPTEGGEVMYWDVIGKKILRESKS